MIGMTFEMNDLSYRAKNQEQTEAWESVSHSAVHILFHRLDSLLTLEVILGVWYDLEMAFQRSGMFEMRKIKIMPVE